MFHLKFPSRIILLCAAVAIAAVVLAGCTTPAANVIMEQTSDVGESSSGSISFVEALPSSISPEPMAWGEVEQATLIDVIDGDTLYLRLADGTEEKCRLIGIDAPESVHPDESRNTPEGEDASSYMASLVSAGQLLYLEPDVSDRDKYDRLLRYVWVREPGARDVEDVRTGMLNGMMLDAGHAQAKRYPPDTAYADIFDAIEASR